MKNLKSILWGIALVIIGIIVALNRLEITNINIFFDGWWTLFIIIPSFIGIFDRNGRVLSIILFIVGILLLLSAQHIIDFDNVSKLIFPLILIIVGLSIVFKSVANNVDIPKVKNDKEYYATFSNQKILIDNKFDGCDVNAVFGGIDLNLSEAKIKNGSVIKVSSIFGGTKIVVPKNIKVEVKSTSLFGAVDNKIKNNKMDKTTLYVEALCLFGGVEIK